MVTDPNTGVKLRLTGDTPPTEAELEQIFAQQTPQKGGDQQVVADDISNVDQLRQAILNAPLGSELAEFGAAVNRGAANLVDFFTTKPARAIQQLAGVEEDSRIPAITQTELGQAATKGDFMQDGLAKTAIRTAGEMTAPAGVGGAVLKTVAKAVPATLEATTGQRVASQLGKTTAAQDVSGGALSGAGLELGGAGGEAVDIALGGTGETGREIGKFAGSVALPVAGSIITQTGKSLATTGAKKLLTEAAPTIDGLKTAARQVYKEIDDLGAIVNSRRITRLGNELNAAVRKEGFNKRIHPKVSAALDEFNAVKGTDQKITELDTLRKITQSAANSIDPDEKRLGTILINRIDDTLDSLTVKDFKAGGGDVGAKFKDARQLWRRAKKAEQLDDAWKNAELSPAGFENGIRQQFRAILKSKKKSTGFTADEKKAMREVVNGNTLRNFSEKLGMLGIDERRVSGALMPLMGSASGAFAFGGGVGAVAVPVLGTLSKKLGLRLARNAGRGAQAIVKAGNNGADVVKAYIKVTPRKQLDSKELTELLLRPDVSIKGLEAKLSMLPKEHKKLITDAVFLANTMREEINE